MARFALLYSMRLRLFRSRLVRLCCIPIALAPLLLILPVSQAPAPALGWEDVVMAWTDIFRSPPPRPLRGVGRGDKLFCAIAPFPTEAEADVPVIVTNRPVFVWRGGAEWLKVRSAETGVLLWEKDLTTVNPDEMLHRVAYVGLPLQPGQIYEWEIKPHNLAALLPIEFRVLSIAEQAEVDAELRSRQTAVERADYWAERQLWSAFWDEVLSVEAPTAELQTVMETTVQYSCDS